jgi:aryl-alcohol dehydrogenase-like predicted oxidoreductase
VEKEILATCRELGIGFVAYSPLGRAFLAHQIRKLDDLDPSDWRRNSPRFQGDNLIRNLELARRLGAIAGKKGCTPAQLALAWLLAQAEDIIPIPGIGRRSHLEENLRSVEIELTPEDLRQIDAAAPVGAAAGDRYPEPAMKAVNR